MLLYSCRKYGYFLKYRCPTTNSEATHSELVIYSGLKVMNVNFKLMEYLDHEVLNLDITSFPKQL